jgi:hypothetical protein
LSFPHLVTTRAWASDQKLWASLAVFWAVYFGLVGCRRSVPHLQRRLGQLKTSLKDLERAIGVLWPATIGVPRRGKSNRPSPECIA